MLLLPAQNHRMIDLVVPRDPDRGEEQGTVQPFVMPTAPPDLPPEALSWHMLPAQVIGKKNQRKDQRRLLGQGSTHKSHKCGDYPQRSPYLCCRLLPHLKERKETKKKEQPSQNVAPTRNVGY